MNLLETLWMIFCGPWDLISKQQELEHLDELWEDLGNIET